MVVILTEEKGLAPPERGFEKEQIKSRGILPDPSGIESGDLGDAPSHQRAKCLMKSLRRVDSIGVQRSGGVS